MAQHPQADSPQTLTCCECGRPLEGSMIFRAGKAAMFCGVVCLARRLVRERDGTDDRPGK